MPYWRVFFGTHQNVSFKLSKKLIFKSLKLKVCLGRKYNKAVKKIMNLTDKETKLLWLMLNNATEPGEVRNSSAALARSLRERGVQAADLCSTVRSGDALASNRENYEWCSIPWGKHKGAPFRDVPLHYLNWVLDSWEHINSPDWSSLKTNIIGFLGRNPQN